METLPLHDMHVLDLTRLLPGPYTSLILAELGAEVIKVEQPPRGDPLRWMSIPDARVNQALFRLLNHGKKSMLLDIKSASGRRVLLELSRHADVLLEGYRPGVMRRLGLDYDTVAAMNPRLVYASMSGYGQSGPHSARAGHDLNYVARSGLLDLTGVSDGAPVIPGIPVADVAAGLWAAMGIVAALLGRTDSGRGRYIDVSLMDAAISLLVTPLAEWLGTDYVPQRGSSLLNGGLACYNVYRTADENYVTLAALEPTFWSAFCQATGQPDWLERQNDADQRGLTAELAALFRTQTRAFWSDLSASVDCCCEPVLALDEVFTQSQVTQRGLQEGQFTVPIDLRRAADARAPELGEHTAAVLQGLGHMPAESDQPSGML